MTARAPYQREIMDAHNDPAIDGVVLMKSAQIGATEILGNIVGYHMHQDPCPILVLQPTLEMGEAWSKDRLAPMLRDSPVLRGRVGDPRARDKVNTVRHKVFSGGHLTVCGANSPASLASRPVRIVLCDEVDRYPTSAGTEGDPISLARKRSATFWNRRLILASTPTIKGASRIESAYEQSTQDQLWVPCSKCNVSQVLEWAQVKWSDRDPATAAYECLHCRERWGDVQRWAAVRDGEWRSRQPERRMRGFHLSELYSPWTRLEEMVAAFLEAKHHPETLKTWVNTVLGQTWEEEADQADAEALMSREEHYGPDVPQSALVLTAGVDVQGNRLEVELVAWAPDMESWSMAYEVLSGDPEHPQVWRQLDELLLDPWKHESGHRLRVAATAVDANAYTDHVYAYCRRRKGRHVYAVRGMGGQGLPLIHKRAYMREHGVIVHTLGVDRAKDSIIAALAVTEPGPGYCHFPAGRDPGYYEQLTSERAVTKYRQGRATRIWIQDPGVRNEALDLRVYARAALEILRPRWNLYRQRLSAPVRDESAEQTPERPTIRQIRRRPRPGQQQNTVY